jgi:hypothetical protein
MNHSNKDGTSLAESEERRLLIKENTFSSDKSKPIVSFCSEIYLICFAAAVLTFFIAGLLYLLCFERIDNLGAYGIPSETGRLPSHPM